MLFRSDDDEAKAGLIAVTQPGRAWLAGQIVRAWGNEGFARPSPYEEVCLTIQQQAALVGRLMVRSHYGDPSPARWKSC